MIEQSKEFYRNLPEGSEPPWDYSVPFEEQTDEVQLFWAEEFRKLREGVTIDGIYITPWLYWHLNFWNMFVDKPDGSRIKEKSTLRDNEWFFNDCIERAKKAKKGVAMFGTRRFGKALLNSEVVQTPKGPRRIDSVFVGNPIYTQDGTLTTIKGVYPQGIVKIYRISFADGRSIKCCEDHLWRVKRYNQYHTVSLKSLLHMDYKSFSIDIAKAVQYPPNDTRISPMRMGTEAGLFLTGIDTESFYIDDDLEEAYILSTPSQKQMFIDAFIDVVKYSTVSWHTLKVSKKNKRVVQFVADMFRAGGWYFKQDEDTIYFDDSTKEVAITNIEYLGFGGATCIEVEHNSRLYLTTDYVVTHNTSMIASYTSFRATMTLGLEHQVLGFSQVDLDSITTYMEFGLNKIHPFLNISKPSNNWRKEVILGTKDTKNVRDIHARIKIINLNLGRKQATQKPAGGTPSTAIWDEIGKGNIIGPFQAAMPSYDTPYGWRTTPILTGTGGESEISKDAQTLLGSPDTYNLILMDWDFLNNKTTTPTWSSNKWSCFVPGQMSLKYSEKKDMSIAEYLGKPETPLTKKIRIQATDFEATTNKMKESFEILKKSNDRKQYLTERRYYPLRIDDCFMNSTVNEFPVEDAVIHLNELLELEDQGKAPGMNVDIERKGARELSYVLSNKSVAEVPFRGGICDAPVTIYELPESNNLNDYIYVAGLDPYKQEIASSDSVGSFYIYKRYTRVNDPYANKIVLSYNARPAQMDDFCKTVEIAQEAYGAICLQENADLMYEMYLRFRNKDQILLATGEEVAQMGNPRARQNHRLGMSPTTANISLRMGYLKQYCWDEIVVGYNEDTGEEITKKGIYRIDDVMLLREIIHAHEWDNLDRITSFSHALALAQYYDKMNFLPESVTQKMEREKREQRHTLQERRYDFDLRRGPYRIH